MNPTQMNPTQMNPARTNPAIQPVAPPKTRTDSRAHRWISTAAGAVLQVATVAVWKQGPEIAATVTDPIRTGGALGEEISTHAFRIRVTKVTTSPTAEEFGRQRTTAGVFVTIELAGQGVGEPWSLGRAALESGGKRYFADSAMLPAFQPELWRTERLLFEVPAGRVRGAHLVVGVYGLITQLTAEADIDLKAK